MKRFAHLAMIAHDMGLIFEFLGIVSFLPFLVLAIFKEWDLVLPMWFRGLEIVPVTIIAMGIVKEIRDDIASGHDTGNAERTGVPGR